MPCGSTSYAVCASSDMKAQLLHLYQFTSVSVLLFFLSRPVPIPTCRMTRARLRFIPLCTTSSARNCCWMCVVWEESEKGEWSLSGPRREFGKRMWHTARSRDFNIHHKNTREFAGCTQRSDCVIWAADCKLRKRLASQQRT